MFIKYQLRSNDCTPHPVLSLYYDSYHYSEFVTHTVDQGELFRTWPSSQQFDNTFFYPNVVIRKVICFTILR